MYVHLLIKRTLLSATYLHVLFIAASESCHSVRLWNSGHVHLLFLPLRCDFVLGSRHVCTHAYNEQVLNKNKYLIICFLIVNS
jgi:hypothetical protein